MAERFFFHSKNFLLFSMNVVSADITYCFLDSVLILFKVDSEMVFLSSLVEAIAIF